MMTKTKIKTERSPEAAPNREAGWAPTITAGRRQLSPRPAAEILSPPPRQGEAGPASRDADIALSGACRLIAPRVGLRHWATPYQRAIRSD